MSQKYSFKPDLRDSKRSCTITQDAPPQREGPGTPTRRLTALDPNKSDKRRKAIEDSLRQRCSFQPDISKSQKTFTEEFGALKRTSPSFSRDFVSSQASNIHKLAVEFNRNRIILSCFRIS